MTNILYIIEVILGLLIIITIFMQPSKSDALSGIIQGGTNKTFFSKNKSKTKESIIVKSTWISFFLFVLNTLIITLYV